MNQVKRVVAQAGFTQPLQGLSVTRSLSVDCADRVFLAHEHFYDSFGDLCDLELDLDTALKEQT